MLLFKEKNTLKRTLRYLFFVTLILWVLTTIYVVYQYLWSSSKQVITKGGTFVEGIFNSTSFLPYLNNDRQSKFYQGLLFNSCLDLELDSDGNLQYKDNLCHVTTRDYKNYYVSVESGHIRSDGVPFSIDDVLFTYNEIIKSNKLGIEYLDIYKDIEVELEGNKVKVVFKNSSEDNTLFFTNYILPKHALIDPNLDMYQQSFAIEPIYNNCAKIKPQSIDQYSLIFDLSRCEDTSLGFYQIKNTVSFDNFKEGLTQNNGSIVDAYVGKGNLKGYQEINLESNKLVTVFFNTKDSKMKVRLRRSLGGLIIHNFFDGDENEYMKKYDRNIFNYYLSTGNNIQDFINRIDIQDGISKDELIDSGVGELTGEIDFTKKHKAFAFYTQDPNQKYLLKLNFDEEYKKIAIKHNSGDLYYPDSYDPKKKHADYGIATEYENFDQGLNRYIIYSIDEDNEDKKDQIGTLNIYNFHTEENNGQAIKEQLKILYFDNNLSNYVVGKLKQIFKKYDISNSFIYEKVNDTNELEGKLIAGEYDILINTINMGLSTDISKLFSTELANINPSQYTNARLLSLLKQYNESKNKSSIIGEINNIYSNDMPMVILGREYLKLNIKEQIINRMDIEDMSLYEYNWRDEIYNNLSLTENVYIDKDKAKDLSNFWRFIKDPNNY